MPRVAIIWFCLLSLALRSTTDTYTALTTKRYDSRSVKSENLKMTLDYVRDKRQFHSSLISLVFADARCEFGDMVSRYVANQSTVSYKITTDDLSSRKYTWQNRVDLTWIFVVDDINVIYFLINQHAYIWKATNQYVIIVTVRDIAPAQEQFLRIVWEKYSVYKSIVISIRQDFRCLHRFLPFEKNQKKEYGIVSEICPMAFHRQNGKNVVDDELYANLANLNGYPMRVLVFPSLMMNVTFDKETKGAKFSRLDADAMSLLEEAMGMKFRVKIISNLGNEDPFHRTLRYIESGESEMIVTGFFIHEYKEYRRYEFTTSVYEDKLCLIAPTAGFVPKSYMPILPFAGRLWAVLAVYNLCVSILWFLVKYYSVSFHRRQPVLLPLTTRFLRRHRSNLRPPIHPYVSSCFDLVEASCYPLKEAANVRGTSAQRAFLFGTLFFGLIVTGLYQSCLVSSLSEPFHYPELDTLEDVANSNLTIITKYYNLKLNTFTENTTLANRLNSKTEVLVSDKPTNDMVAFTRKVIALGRYASIKLDNLSNYYDEDGNELLHIVAECPTTYLLSYVVRLHSPYLERINGLLLRMREAGLVRLWYENMTYPMYADEQRRKVAKGDRKVKLTVEHYSLTFIGLFIGLFFCVLVFLAELYFLN